MPLKLNETNIHGFLVLQCTARAPSVRPRAAPRPSSASPTRSPRWWTWRTSSCRRSSPRTPTSGSSAREYRLHLLVTSVAVISLGQDAILQHVFFNKSTSYDCLFKSVQSGSKVHIYFYVITIANDLTSVLNICVPQHLSNTFCLSRTVFKWNKCNATSTGGETHAART